MISNYIVCIELLSRKRRDLVPAHTVGLDQFIQGVYPSTDRSMACRRGCRYRRLAMVVLPFFPSGDQSPSCFKLSLHSIWLAFHAPRTEPSNVVHLLPVTTQSFTPCLPDLQLLSSLAIISSLFRLLRDHRLDFVSGNTSAPVL